MHWCPNTSSGQSMTRNKILSQARHLSRAVRQKRGMVLTNHLEEAPRHPVTDPCPWQNHIEDSVGSNDCSITISLFMGQ